MGSLNNNKEHKLSKLDLTIFLGMIMIYISPLFIYGLELISILDLGASFLIVFSVPIIFGILIISVGLIFNYKKTDKYRKSIILILILMGLALIFSSSIDLKLISKIGLLFTGILIIWAYFNLKKEIEELVNQK